MRYAREPAFSDGTYQAIYDSFERNGWKPQLTLTVQCGRITGAEFDYFDRNGQMKTRNQAYAAQMKFVTGVAPAEVDTVTGATSTSNQFISLAGQVQEPR